MNQYKGIKSITSVKKFLIGDKLIDKLNELSAGLGKHAFVIADKAVVKEMEERLPKIYSEKGYKVTLAAFSGECTDNEINKLANIAKKANADYVIGMGGGKGMDTGKAVAELANLPVVMVPTLASTDAACTSVSLIYNEDHSFNRYWILKENPDMVFVDPDIIKKAPLRTFVSGIGDALGTYFEAQACYDAEGTNLPKFNPSYIGLGLAKMCYTALRDYGVQSVNAIKEQASNEAVSNLLEATVYLSGIGVEGAGLAAAHAFYDATTILEDLETSMHGEKVGFGTLLQFVLYGDQKGFDDVIRFMHSVGLPLTLEELGMKKWNDKDWMQVAINACDPNDSMVNLPFTVTPQMVFDAIKITNKLAHEFKDSCTCKECKK